MKRVRYLAGAVGLVPLAVAAAAAPGAPRSANAPAAAVGKAKAVTLDLVVNATCKGNINHQTPSHPGEFESFNSFFYKRLANSHWCIGTVNYYEGGNAGGGYDMRTRIYTPLGHRVYQHYNGGTISTLHNGISFTDGVHQSFGPGARIQVCTAMVSQGAAHNVVSGRVVCGSV
jgi:hypothetical protein